VDDIAAEAPEIDYGAWGQLFLEHAVTIERVLAGVNVMAERPLEVGPIAVGPGRLAKVRATGRVGVATGRRLATAPALCFAVDLPVSVRLTLDLTMDRQRYDADLVVPLRITARTAADLTILIDVASPSPHEVEVDLRAQGLRASLTQMAAGIDSELRRFVARYVAREIQSTPKGGLKSRRLGPI